MDPPRDSTYRENETATFKCKYDGNPRPEVSKYHAYKIGKMYSVLEISMFFFCHSVFLGFYVH